MGNVDFDRNPREPLNVANRVKINPTAAVPAKSKGFRRLAYPLLLLCLLSTETSAIAAELPAVVKARLFERTRSVSFSRAVVLVAMRGSDHAGNSKCPYLRVYVNGKGPFTFLYDTGASYMIVSSAVAKAAGTRMIFNRGGARDVVQLDRLALGGFDVHGAWAIVDDNFGVDGVIGFPTLGNAIVSIDLAHRQMALSRAPQHMQHPFTLPYTAPGGVDVPAVPVGIGGRTVPILIDTGDDAYALEVRSTELKNSVVEDVPVSAGTVMNGSREQKTSTATLRDHVTLGPTEAVSPDVAVNDDLPIGDLGYDALRQFRFQIDPVHHTVTFQPLFRGKVFRIALGRK